MKIKIQNKEKIWNGKLYKFYTVFLSISESEKIEFEANRLEASATTKSTEYYGDDIINLCNMQTVNVETGMGLSYIGGRPYSEEEIIEEKEYNYQSWEDYKDAGWCDEIENAVLDCLFD